MDQNLSGYKIFYEVARNGNISKAAKKLYISQPAISKSIVKLEDGLDTKLFKRNSRGVTLTEEGEVLYAYVKDAFEALQTAENELRRMKEFNIGHILVGASATLCRYVLLPYLKRFMECFPNIRVSIVTQDSARNISLLEQRKLDIGLVAEPKFANPEFRMVSAREIQDVFVATPQYIQNLVAVFGEGFNIFTDANIMLLNQNNLSRRHVDDYFKLHGIEPIQILEVSTMDLLIEFAKVGIGVSCVVRNFVEKDLERGQLVEIPLNTSIPKRRIGFVYNEGNMSKSLEAFLGILV